MNPELEQKLYIEFPKLFAQKDLDNSKSLMGYGCCCGDGWYAILRGACERTQAVCDKEGFQVEFVQVKGKFDRLRVYYDLKVADAYSKTIDGFDAIVGGILEEAEGESLETCEVCGGILEGAEEVRAKRTPCRCWEDV